MEDLEAFSQVPVVCDKVKFSLRFAKKSYRMHDSLV